MSKPVRAEVRINADEIVDGVPHRTCPKCKELKPLDDFGLRKMGVPGKHGGDLITNQSYCHACR